MPNYDQIPQLLITSHFYPYLIYPLLLNNFYVFSHLLRLVKALTMEYTYCRSKPPDACSQFFLKNIVRP